MTLHLFMRGTILWTAVIISREALAEAAAAGGCDDPEPEEDSGPDSAADASARPKKFRAGWLAEQERKRHVQRVTVSGAGCAEDAVVVMLDVDAIVHDLCSTRDSVIKTVRRKFRAISVPSELNEQLSDLGYKPFKPRKKPAGPETTLGQSAATKDRTRERRERKAERPRRDRRKANPSEIPVVSPIDAAQDRPGKPEVSENGYDCSDDSSNASDRAPESPEKSERAAAQVAQETTKSVEPALRQDECTSEEDAPFVSLIDPFTVAAPMECDELSLSPFEARTPEEEDDGFSVLVPKTPTAKVDPWGNVPWDMSLDRSDFGFMQDEPNFF